MTFKYRMNILIKGSPELYLTDGVLKSYPPQYITENPSIISNIKEERLKNFSGIDIEESRINAVMSHNLRSELHKIKHQTLVVCASDDQKTPVELSEELAENIPNTNKKIFSYGGHFTPHTQTENYNKLLIQFLKK